MLLSLKDLFDYREKKAAGGNNEATGRKKNGGKRMIEKSKLQELEQRIAEKKKEIDGLRKQRANSEEPSEMVLLDKQIADASSCLFALERAKNAVTYMPPQPTDKQLLLSGVNKYLQAKKEKIREAEEIIKQTEKKLRTAEYQLAKATEDGDADRVVTCSEKCDELKKRLEYVHPMKTTAENRQAFPDGAILEEWAKVCEKVRPDFMLLLTRIGLLAEEYRAACDELMSMNDTLLKVREEMGRIARNNGFVVSFFPILTAGLDVGPLKISKVDGLKPGFIMNGLHGKGL